MNWKKIFFVLTLCEILQEEQKQAFPTVDKWCSAGEVTDGSKSASHLLTRGNNDAAADI